MVASNSNKNTQLVGLGQCNESEGDGHCFGAFPTHSVSFCRRHAQRGKSFSMWWSVQDTDRLGIKAINSWQKRS